MATLQVRDIDDRLYEALRDLANKKHRSISQEVIRIIEVYLSNPQREFPDQTEAFLALSDAWEGPESAEELIDTIRGSRINTNRFAKSDGLFN